MHPEEYVLAKYSVSFNILCFTGEVAFISGGHTLTSVELFTPEGNCKPAIAPLLISMFGHLQYFRKNQIFACKGQTTHDCYVYTIANGSWNLFSKPTTASAPFNSYNDNIYFYPYYLLNLTSKLWLTWPSPSASAGACVVTWKDSFIIFGGQGDYTGVQMYNHTTQSTKTLQTSLAPMQIYSTGCTIMPNERVLIVGSGNQVTGAFNKLAIYSISTNTWPYSGTLPFDCGFSKVFVLGKRVFFICTSIKAVMEFHYGNNTFTSTANSLQVIRDNSPGVVTVPARLFSRLPGGCKAVL